MSSKQEGIVLEVYGAMAKVKTSRHNNCENCGACPGNSALVLDAQNPVSAQVGQRVEVEVREANMLKAAFIVFILPLVAASAGVLAGGWLAAQVAYDMFLLQMAGGITAFGLAAAYIKYFDRSARSNTGMQPVITRIYNN